MYSPSTIRSIARTIQPDTDVTPEQEKLMRQFGITLEEYAGKGPFIRRKLMAKATERESLLKKQGRKS